MMKLSVLHVVPSVSREFGGPTESLIGYCQAAIERDAIIHVAAPQVTASEEVWLGEVLPEVRFHFFRSVGKHTWIIAPGLWRWLLSRVCEFDVAHIHGLFNPVSSLGARISVVRGVPTVIRPFGTLSRYTFSRRSVLKNIYFALVDRPSLQRATGFHFTTEGEREEAGRLKLDVHEKGFVVPPPWRGTVAEAEIERKAERPTVLFLSRLHPKKNLVSLIDAWSDVVRRRQDAQLWIAGTGEREYEEKVRKKIGCHGVGGSVSLLGFVSGEEKMRALRKSWVFVLPSDHENFGVAVLEALASGLPVVVSKKVQLAPFVSEYNLGVVLDQTNPGDIADGTAFLLGATAFRRRVGEVAPTLVEETFNLDRVGRRLMKMYRKASFMRNR